MCIDQRDTVPPARSRQSRSNSPVDPRTYGVVADFCGHDVEGIGPGTVAEALDKLRSASATPERPTLHRLPPSHPGRPGWLYRIHSFIAEPRTGDYVLGPPLAFLVAEAFTDRDWHPAGIVWDVTPDGLARACLAACLCAIRGPMRYPLSCWSCDGFLRGKAMVAIDGDGKEDPRYQGAVMTMDRFGVKSEDGSAWPRDLLFSSVGPTTQTYVADRNTRRHDLLQYLRQ